MHLWRQNPATVSDYAPLSGRSAERPRSQFGIAQRIDRLVNAAICLYVGCLLETNSNPVRWALPLSLRQPIHDRRRRMEVGGRVVELHSILDVLCRHRCNQSKSTYPGNVIIFKYNIYYQISGCKAHVLYGTLGERGEQGHLRAGFGNVAMVVSRWDLLFNRFVCYRRGTN